MPDSTYPPQPPAYPPHLQPVPSNGATAEQLAQQLHEAQQAQQAQQQAQGQFNPNTMFAQILAGFNEVVPQPTNCQYRIDLFNHPAGNQVLLSIMTPIGMFVQFIQPDVAVSIGETLIRTGRQASTGLFVPGPGAV